MSYPPREALPDLPMPLPSKREKAIETALTDAILRVRRAPLCVVCGNGKEPGRWFDKTCYFTLPHAMRNSLWSCDRQSDAELRDCYVRAADYLAGMGKRFVPRQKMPLEAQQIIAETGFSVALTAYLMARD